ncbi:preprotein translocase subunit YajC [Streptacidiphilus sp. N1-12]|uniref:Preprotein translocase subunit YajC n=2 Tax=Streptacidiphilus alkalitolerans TaxID=3342712 RepID=A0ABV6V1Y9_9ACTN
MSSSSLLIVAVVMFGAMFMMTRSAKKKQQQASEMRNKMEPGSGIRTIGGMYALVKAVNDDSVELEVAPGVHAIYAKNAIAVVLDGAEYNRIVHGDVEDDEVEDDDAAEGEPLTADEAATPIGFDKAPSLEKPADAAESPEDEAVAVAEAETEAAAAAEEPAADKGVTAK